MTIRKEERGKKLKALNNARIMDPKIKKWISWLKVARDEVQQPLIAKDVFWTVQGLIKTNKEIQKPSIFYRYLGNTYVSYALMGIRRQIKIDRQSISFAHLLSEIAESTAMISRECYRELYTGSRMEELADRDFDRFCQNPGDPCISAGMVRKDLVQLNEVARACEEFADRRIAHLDKREPKSLPKFREIDEAIDTLDSLYVKYHLILHGGSIRTLMPTYQYDWQEIFDHPWRLVGSSD